MASGSQDEPAHLPWRLSRKRGVEWIDGTFRWRVAGLSPQLRAGCTRVVAVCGLPLVHGECLCCLQMQACQGSTAARLIDGDACRVDRYIRLACLIDLGFTYNRGG